MQVSWEKIPVFAGLKPHALSFLAGKAAGLEAATGSTVVREGEPGNRLYLIRSGEVRVWKNGLNGGRAEIARLQAPEFFGEMCILETLPRAATVEAVSDSELASLSSIAFYQLYEAMPDQYSILILNIARDISRRLRKLDQRFAATG